MAMAMATATATAKATAKANAASRGARALCARAGGGAGAGEDGLVAHWAQLRAGLSDQQRAMVARFDAALASDPAMGGLDQRAREALLADYELLVASVREKMRLTVEWNDTAKLSDKQRVEATAKRVGLDLPKERK
mmetsp:Transcript_7829/g.24970  ORF Transcript_7829/g.24970 Transcript_7829/m.24970 type:complete len:136 (+) Transcript_7829:501-908(+)